jgi:hypothetical protein
VEEEEEEKKKKRRRWDGWKRDGNCGLGLVVVRVLMASEKSEQDEARRDEDGVLGSGCP